MTQVRDALLGKLTFKSLKLPLVILQSLQHQRYMLQMLLIAGTIDEDVVEKYQHKLTQVIMQGIIHGTEECSWCTSKTDSHNSEFKLSIVGLECSFKFFP